MTYLIVNADDFGLTPGINRSIFELERAGALTSATLMATADHFREAVSGTNQYQRLGVGCHVVLVDGTPALPAGQIPALAAASGEFRPTLGSFVADLLRGKIPEAEIEAEAIAQIRSLQAAGVHVTHIDTHKHTHMFVRVLRPLLRAAKACGVQAIRNPFEPAWAADATPDAPQGRRLQVTLLRSRRRTFLRLVGDAGLATTDGAIGVLATGTLNTITLRQLFSAMPQGTWELVCHPGHLDPSLESVRTRLRESRAVEHDALIDVIPPHVQTHPEITLAHFGQLAGLPL